MYDDEGNSIWFQGTGSSASYTSPTTVTFSVQSDIVGGTKKFKMLQGKLYNRHFNLATTHG
ncbi:MAG: hypothetical protein ABR503_00410 [Chitinophagaceae bacterium]